MKLMKCKTCGVSFYSHVRQTVPVYGGALSQPILMGYESAPPFDETGKCPHCDSKKVELAE